MGQEEGYFSNLIKREEQPVIPSLQIGVGWQRLDHLYKVDKSLIIGKEHNTRALRNIPYLMSPSQLAHTEHPHRRRQVLSGADCLLTSEKHLGVPTGKELIQLHLKGNSEQRMTSERLQHFHCKEHLSLNELLRLGLSARSSGCFRLQENIHWSFVSNLHPHISYIINKDEREHYPKLVFRSSVIGRACYSLFSLRSQQKEHTSHVVLHAWSLNTGL